MARKELSELTIVDDFMFGAVMKDPEKCKPLLEYILDIKINRIEYPKLQRWSLETMQKEKNRKH